MDAAERTIAVAGGDPIGFDSLLIATGARNRRFPIPGIDLTGVLDLRTLGDAARIRAEMLPGRRVVMAGMGFIGSEVAASLRQRGFEVHVVAGGKAPLDRVLGEDIGRVIEGIHRDHGVEMTFDDQVAGFEGDGRLRAVTTASGLRLDCDFVVLGLGVEPVTASSTDRGSTWTTGCSSTSTAGRTWTACSPPATSLGTSIPSSGSG